MTHLDAEVLAEFRAGLITGRRGARITAHLAGCDRCTALGDQLAGVSALLASVPLPVMPDSLAHRLDTVLAAEAARPAQVKTDQAERVHAERPAPPATSRARRSRPRLQRLSLRVLAPVTVVVLAAGGYGLSLIAGPGGHVTASSTSSASSGSSAERAEGQAPAASAAASSRDNAPKSPPVRGAQGAVPLPQRITAANFALVASTVNFSADPATLKQQVEQELRTASPTGASATAPPVTRQLRECVQNLTRGATLVRVESARFQGKPATLVVARTGPGDTAWIAGPDCSATSRDVLATTTVPAGTSGP
jgi:hypothetical protein